ncbi:hypothetical protein H6758_03815 [Candidatus Nomurabacteria bacterium]|nr:hypothetical protein [Candidatus Nomurabacteria bacterium]
MQFGTRKTIEDDVLASLQDKPMIILDLIALLQRRNANLTKQGVYYAIRKLRAAQMVVVEKGKVSLNASWIQEMENYFSHAKQTYLHQHSQPGSFLGLSDKEKISYHFKDAIATDVFWNHAITILLSSISPSEPFIAYNPHAWFFIAHPQNEIALRDNVTQMGRQYFVTVGYKTPLDAYAKKFFDNEMSQYHMLEYPQFEKENYYLNILDDFLIEVYIDTHISKCIHTFYLKQKKFDKHTPETFNAILKSRGKIRLVISRNEKKAKRLKGKLLRHFHKIK